MRMLHGFLLTLLLGGCTATEFENATPQELAREEGYVLGSEVEEIYNYRVDGWNHVTDRALIISAGPGTRYLLTLKTECHYLSNTEVIGYTTTTNQLTRFDAVVVADPASGIDQKCFIDRIYRVTRDQ